MQLLSYLHGINVAVDRMTQVGLVLCPRESDLIAEAKGWQIIHSITCPEGGGVEEKFKTDSFCINQHLFVCFSAFRLLSKTTTQF